MAKVTYNIINTNDTEKLLIQRGSVVKVFLYLTKCSYGYKNTCCPSQHTIAKALGLCTKTIQRAIKTLIKLKLIIRKRRQRNSNVYILLNKPIKNDIKENIKTENIKTNIKKKIDDFNNFQQRKYKKNKVEDYLNGLCEYEDLLE